MRVFHSRSPRGFRCALGLLFLVGTGLPANAATPTDPSILDEQRRQQQLRDEEIERRLRERPAPAAPAPEIEAVRLLPEGECQTIRRVFLYGADRLSPRRQRALIRPDVGRCLDNAGLTALVRHIQETYLRAGYITTRIGVKDPQASLDRGNLELWVIEGRIGRFVPGGNSPFDRSRIRAAFPVREGEVLNVHDLDQGIENLNRLFSQSFRMQLQPGTRAGYSDIVLSNELADRPQDDPAGRRQFGYRYGNGGIDATGRDLHSFDFTRENRLGVNDSANFSWQNGMPFAPAEKENVSLRASVSRPLGYWRMDASQSYARTVRLVPGTPVQFRSRGDILTTRLTASRTLDRSQASKWEAGAGFDYSVRDNYINDTLVQVSSRTVAALDAGLTYTRYFGSATFIVNAKLVQGVPWFGALGDTDGLAPSDPHAQYALPTLYLFYRQPIRLTGRAGLTWESAMNGQYAPVALYGERQFVLGGEYSVRGFKDNALSDDSGVSWRNDFILPVGEWAAGLHQRAALLGLGARLFVDGGHTYSNSGSAMTSLAGWGAGIDYRYRDFSLYVHRAQPLAGSDQFTTPEDWVTYLGLNYRRTW